MSYSWDVKKNYQENTMIYEIIIYKNILGWTRNYVKQQQSMCSFTLEQDCNKKKETRRIESVL